MRTSARAAALLVLVALASGCTSADDAARPAGGSSPSATEGGSGEDRPEVEVVDSRACQEVRDGIAAFNRGDFAETVERFVAALPLAEERDDGSLAAGQLVDAVRYYAELRPARYPEAARTSPDFARNKAITLGQCMPAGYEAPEGATV